MKSYCYNLGLSTEEIQKIRVGFYVQFEDVEVYEKNGSVYAAFLASSEKEIDRMIEEACDIILFYYPKLSLEGTAFEEKPE